MKRTVKIFTPKLGKEYTDLSFSGLVLDKDAALRSGAKILAFIIKGEEENAKNDPAGRLKLFLAN